MRVPIPLQTVYAELVEQAAIREIEREFPDYGGFSQKTVKGRRYIYWQGQLHGVRRQKFVGPDEPATWARIDRAKRLSAADDTRARLVDALANAGFPRVPATGGKVLRALADAGTFRRGGTLIGTWAYLAYGPMLGVILPAGLAQTQDLDILQIEVAMDDRPADLLGALREVDATFEPSFSRAHDGPPYAFHNADGYRIEFVTIQSRKAQRAPVMIADLGIGALPLPFLEYLLESTVEAVLLFRSGVSAKVPSPERFALHKLIVAQRRGATATPAKKQKDIAQAQSLLSVLIEDRPNAVRSALKDLTRRGPAWRRAANASIRRLDAATQNFLNRK